MNYLIITFDGFGDGVMYTPIFKDLGEKNPGSSFYYTSNVFFSDKTIFSKIKIPPSFKVVDNSFRRFSKDYWGEIRLFIEKNNINRVINLRIIGRRFEKDYYEFKDWFTTLNNEVYFFDDETLQNSEKLNTNVRNNIIKIIQKALNKKIIYNTSILKSLFYRSSNTGHILINPHSGGAFKLWNLTKWAVIINSLILMDEKIKIYEGFSSKERLYTTKIVSKLPVSSQLKIKVIKPKNLYKLGKSLQKISMLISVDSGLIHFCDSIGVKSLGIYITTSPIMWGGISDRFNYIESKHMTNCKNFYSPFGMCMNKKKKCAIISGKKDDIDVKMVLKKAKQIYYEKEN